MEEEKHTGWLVFLFLSGDHSPMFFLIWLFILVFLILDVWWLALDYTLLFLLLLLLLRA